MLLRKPLLACALGLLAACGEPPPAATPVADEAALVQQAHAEVDRLLAAGQLRAAVDAAARLRAQAPQRLEGWLLGARALRAQRDRRGVRDLLEEAYQRDPDGFRALRELVDHKLAGPESASQGLEVERFLEAHRAQHPKDEAQVRAASLMVSAYLLGQEDHPDAAGARAQAEALLASTRELDSRAHPYVHADRADVLVGLGRLEKALEESRLSVRDAPETWTVYTQRWGEVCILLHLGREAEARAALRALEKDVRAWEGLHFGMTKPLWSWMALTSWVRFGERLGELPRERDIDARALAEGIKPQYGDAEARAAVSTLLATEEGALPQAAADVEGLLGVLERDRGCEMENKVIRPHARALLHVLRARMYAQAGDVAGARTQLEAARGAFPGDPWMEVLTVEWVRSVGSR